METSKIHYLLDAIIILGILCKGNSIFKSKDLTKASAPTLELGMNSYVVFGTNNQTADFNFIKNFQKYI